MPLSDSQIERYCRQIVLPEIGSRGQERLLDAVVSIFGEDDAALVCATYLAAAGIGRLALGNANRRPRSLSKEDPALGLDPALGALRDRNPDCQILDIPPEAPDAAIWIGLIPERLTAADATLVLYGSTDEHVLITVRFRRGRACVGCLREVVLPSHESSKSEIAQPLLGAMLAQEALRAILGLGDDVSEILHADLALSSFVRLPFSRRPGCPTCG